MKGFATLKKVVNVQFVAEVRAEVVERSRDQLELFSLSEEERNSIFGSPGFCSDSSLLR